MRIGFTYDVLENVFAANEDGPFTELTTELFTASQANCLVAALKKLGHQLIVIDGASEFASRVQTYKRELDLVFNEAKGLFGPDRKMIVPALCRIYGIPCLGSDAYAVTLARNKWHTLAVAAISGVEIPASALFHAADGESDVWTNFPAIVKPNFESSSIGITEASVIHDPAALRRQVAAVLRGYHQPALVQSYIPGVEVQVSIIGNTQPRILGVIEVLVDVKGGRRRDFIINDDWPTANVEFRPFEDAMVTAAVSASALRLYRLLGIRDYGRLDFRIDAAGQPFFLEAATHPHILPDSSFAAAAVLSGLSFEDMVAALIQVAAERSAQGE